MASGSKVSIKQMEQEARHTACRVSPFLVALGRFGYAAKGVIYALIGVLAVQVALGRGGATTDNKGALVQIAQAPFGRLLLVAIAIGFVGYALWRFIQAVLDPERKGSDPKGVVKRIGYGITGALHLAFAGSAVQLLRIGDAGANTDVAAKMGTAQLLSKPLGQWLVALVGLGILGFAGYQFYQAIKATFREKALLGQMNATVDRWYTLLGRVGYAARGFVFGVIGLFLIAAARDANPDDARGLDSALATLAAQPSGVWLLGAVAIGFVAHGLFLFAEARFHRIQVS